MRRLLLLFAFAASSLFATEKLADGLYAEFTTPRGAFLAELYYDKVPMTVASFVGRAEGTLALRNGRPFFTGLIWYRVVPDFVLQSGDPTNPGGGIQSRPPQKSEDEAAGHPLTFPDEIAPGLHHDAAGMLSMANAGPDTNSSEFFVTLRETNRLNYLHSVFGRVVRGLEVLPLIQTNDDLAIHIIRVGAAARAFKADEVAFATLVARAGKYSGLADSSAETLAKAEPGPAAAFDDPDKILPQDVPRARNFNFKLTNFERFTGRKIRARVFKAFTPATAGQKLGQFHAALARQLGVEPEGVLVSYFAELDQWMLWIGDQWLPAFMGRAGSREEFLAGDALMRRKQEFFASAKARAAEAAARQRAEGREVSDAQLLKLTVDEVLDALILLYEPKSQP
jgi:cyclophilin family peptidyl-prolyl cis-trans isomerase